MEMILKEKGLLNITTGIEKCPIDKTRDVLSLNNNERVLLEAFSIIHGKAYNTICLNLGDLRKREV